MADIKTRDAVKGTIKTIDKAAIATERMKSAYAKTKDKAEQGCYADENSATEYAADRLSYGADRIKDEGIHQFNKQGQKAVKETRGNIGKAKDKISAYKQKKAAKAAEQHNNGLQIRHGAASRSSTPDSVQRAKSQFIKTRQQGKKTVKTTARNAEKTVKATAKCTVKTTQKSVKTAQATSKAAIKTAEHTAKATKAAAKASAKAAQRAAQAAKATAKATVAAVKAAVKATIAAVKAIIAGVKALVAAIAAGGWIAVVIIIVICLIALIAGSVFGIFFSGEDSGNGMTMQSVVREINAEYDTRLDEIQSSTTYDVLEMSGSRAVWKEVLAVYSVKTATDPDNPQEVATMDEGKKQLLSGIFWEMNEISSRTESKTETVITESDDGHGNIVQTETTVMINRYERLNQELKMVETKRKVAAYCRVSTDNEDQANSFESQQRYFRQYIERNPDWELYEIFADEGISGTNTKKRKEFNRMIACAKNGDFDLIITKEISRFARNTLDSIYYTRELKKHGVGVIFMNDNINTLDGDAELRLAIMSSIAQEESRKTSERVKWGQKRQMEQGVVFGRSMLGYDVDGGKMTINEEGAKVVRLIFHKFVNEGKGTHVIARELREEGISPMRVKEWSNTVILRVIRNEKYCGDLVQKKTYTPDFLSHEKKYNRGQEEFVIIKDHHEPIISRELFDEANRILDAKSLSQEGKAKHSNRYPFSGKIKCGCCGSSYVARYKTRKDGSRYKAWRCNEAAKHGSPHIDKAGNQVGCTGLSIRNEDATHIMYLVTKSLKYNRNKIINNLTAVIQSIIAMDTTGTDVLKLQEQIKKIEGKRANLIDLYMSNLINKDEFTATRASCDAEIEELQSIIESVDKQREMIEQQQQLLKEIEDAIKEIVSGVEYEDEFYKHILDKMVVQDKDNIDVYLNLLPMKWSYTVAKASKKAVASEWNISEASLPMSVSRAFSSG